jgi:hypothetical protein
MPPINKNIAVLDRKEWQMMTPAPVNTAAGSFVIAAGSGYRDNAMYVNNATVQLLYSHNEDAWLQIPSGALAGTFGAGACGAYTPWSITYTANGGSTTTVTVAAATHNITGECRGDTIEFISAGAATGQRRKITAISNQAGAGTVTMQLDSPVATAILNGHTFRTTSGRFFVMSAGTTAAGSWKAFDVSTRAWQASLVTTNLPATWGTDGKAVSTARIATVLANGTATSGSTTTIVDTAQNWETDQFRGFYVLIVDGTGEGQCAKITGNTSTTLTVQDSKTGAALAVAPAASSVYQIRSIDTLASGVATSGSATTLVNSAKAWTANQWTNYQLRIVSGTGAGQIKTIVSNTATTLTIGSGATLDSTSVYEIEPCEDYIYLAGNNAVTMYRYSISANTWTVLAPTTARTGAPSTGMCLDFVGETGSPLWADENNISDGRFIYSMRGGAGALIDRFDIAGGTAGAGAWQAVNYVGFETFTTGSSAFQFGKFIYIKKDATKRYFKFDIPGNIMYPFNTDLYPDGAAVLGQKLWVRALDSTDEVAWVYSLDNTSSVLRRIGIV